MICQIILTSLHVGVHHDNTYRILVRTGWDISMIFQHHSPPYVFCIFGGFCSVSSNISPLPFSLAASPTHSCLTTHSNARNHDFYTTLYYNPVIIDYLYTNTLKFTNSTLLSQFLRVHHSSSTTSFTFSSLCTLLNPLKVASPCTPPFLLPVV